eukprot:178862_1
MMKTITYIIYSSLEKKKKKKNEVKDEVHNEVDNLYEIIQNVLTENDFPITKHHFMVFKTQLSCRCLDSHNYQTLINVILSDLMDCYIGECYNSEQSISAILEKRLKYNRKKRLRFCYILLTKLTNLADLDQKNFIKLLRLIAFNLYPDIDIDEIAQIAQQNQLNGNVFSNKYMRFGGSKKFVKIFALANNYNKTRWNQIFVHLSKFNLFENPIPIPGSVQHGQLDYDEIKNILEESKFDVSGKEFNILESQLKAKSYTNKLLLAELVNGYVGEYNNQTSLRKILYAKLNYSAEKRKTFYYTLLKKLMKPTQLDNRNFIKILKLIAFNIYPGMKIDNLAEIAKKHRLNGSLFLNGSIQFQKFGNNTKFRKLFALVTKYNTKPIFIQLKQWNLIPNSKPIPGSLQFSKLLMAETTQQFMKQQVTRNQIVQVLDEHLNLQYKPLHHFDSDDIQNVLVKYVLNDVNYKKFLSQS